MVIDPCVLTEPCWLEEYLVDHGVADTDWTLALPAPVIDVVEAMHTRLDRDWYTADEVDHLIAAHFAAAAQVHLEVQQRNGECGPFPAYPLGGRWVPTPEAISAVLEARGRRARRQVTRPLARARQTVPDAQPGLFEMPAQRTAS